MNPTAYDQFLARLGFDTNPFASTNSAEEERLPDYFVKPKYFTSLQGSPARPRSTVVFAPRGSGKTAQKIMLERHGPEVGVLPISYDYFPMPKTPTPEMFDTDYHLRNVIKQGLLSVIAYMMRNGLDASSLTDQQRKNLITLSRTYVGTLSVADIDSFQRSLLGRFERFKEFWNTWKLFGGMLLGPLLAKIGINELPAFAAPSAAQQSVAHHFDLLKSICRDLSFQSIYVLVDRIDETEWTGNRPERSYHMVAALLRNLPLLDDPYVGWKFFLWDKIRPFQQEDARPDRVDQYDLAWEDAELDTMLSQRLRVFSSGRVKSLPELLSDDSNQYSASVILFANRSPRNLVRLCNDVFSEEVERDVGSSSISVEAIESGVLKFCEISVAESYPKEQLRELRKIGRASFTIAWVASKVYKEEPNSTRNRVRGWEPTGLVTQNGTIKLEAGVKPSNYYMVLDPRVVRYIYESLPIVALIRDKSHHCGQCGRRFFTEFEAREDVVICPHCERPT